MQKIKQIRVGVFFPVFIEGSAYTEPLSRRAQQVLCIDGGEILKQDFTDVTSYICIFPCLLPQVFTRQTEWHYTLLEGFMLETQTKLSSVPKFS